VIGWEHPMAFAPLRVGELAKRTGLTVRTLHHYDDIGLLMPSLHTESGHRLYTAVDVGRLQQVVSLRQLGFSLEQVGNCLDEPDFSPLDVIRNQVARLRGQIELERRLCERLEDLAAVFGSAGTVTAEDFLRAIEAMTMIENYYTPEQMEMLKKRSEQVGPEYIKQGQDAWAQLHADVRVAMEQGIDPADPRAQALGRRRRDLVNAFTGGDAGIEQSLKRMWTEQRDKLVAQHGLDSKVYEYLDKVANAAS
jgi:DNA-binding transcriptional MerR regulator